METNVVLNISDTIKRPSLGVLILTDRKINVLKEALRYEYAPKNMADAASLKNINFVQNPMQAKAVELKALSAQYNNGFITIEMYNAALDQMLEYIASNGQVFQIAS
jgi:hypothetical protein